jgi:RNA polymerase sigma factor (sigma-70 family)
MTNHRRGEPGTLTPEEVDYIAVVLETATELARSRQDHTANGGAEDTAQMVCLQFLADPARWMATYPPEVFAAVALRNRSEDWRRSERVQRGQGAHRIVDSDGLQRAKREVDSLDQVLEFGGGGFACTGDTADAVASAIDLQRALDMLDPRDRLLVLLVDREGHTVVDASAILGLSRSYASRRLSAARTLVRDPVTAA